MCRSIIIISFFFISINLYAKWTFELHGGTVWTTPSPLTIRQSGFPDIKLWAKWYAEPFVKPVYWDWRLARWKNGKSWEFEAIHHKMYLANKTPEIHNFSISHGYNILTINRGFEKNKFVIRPGLGVVLAHPESKIRGMDLYNNQKDYEGYYLTGPVAIFSVARPVNISKRFFFNPEAKTTFGYSRVKVARGNADVYSWAFHLIAGFGYNIVK